MYASLKYCLSRVECFLLSNPGCCCVPVLPCCCHAPVTVSSFPFSVCALLTGNDLAAGTLYPAAAIWYFPRLFSVPPLNAALLAVMGEEMLDVPVSRASASLNANGPLQRPLRRIDRGQVLHPWKHSDVTLVDVV